MNLQVVSGANQYFSFYPPSPSYRLPYRFAMKTKKHVNTKQPEIYQKKIVLLSESNNIKKRNVPRQNTLSAVAFVSRLGATNCAPLPKLTKRNELNKLNLT